MCDMYPGIIYLEYFVIIFVIIVYRNLQKRIEYQFHCTVDTRFVVAVSKEWSDFQVMLDAEFVEVLLDVVLKD